MKGDRKGEGEKLFKVGRERNRKTKQVPKTVNTSKF